MDVLAGRKNCENLPLQSIYQCHQVSICKAMFSSVKQSVPQALVARPLRFMRCMKMLLLLPYPRPVSSGTGTRLLPDSNSILIMQLVLPACGLLSQTYGTGTHSLMSWVMAFYCVDSALMMASQLALHMLQKQVLQAGPDFCLLHVQCRKLLILYSG